MFNEVHMKFNQIMKLISRISNIEIFQQIDNFNSNNK